MLTAAVSLSVCIPALRHAYISNINLSIGFSPEDLVYSTPPLLLNFCYARGK